jgi:hypothetical protein
MERMARKVKVAKVVAERTPSPKDRSLFSSPTSRSTFTTHAILTSIAIITPLTIHTIT